MSSLLAARLLAPSHASRQILTWSRNCPTTFGAEGDRQEARPRLARGINLEPPIPLEIQKLPPPTLTEASSQAAGFAPSRLALTFPWLSLVAMKVERHV